MLNGIPFNQLLDDSPMPQIPANRVVDVVLRARESGSSTDEIRKQLTGLGIPAAESASIVDCVEQEFMAGTIAVVTGGVSAADLPLGDSPVFDAAFRRGKAAMRFTTPGWVLLRMVGSWLLLALLLGVVVYFAVA